MKRWMCVGVVVLGAAVLAACGVPREAGWAAAGNAAALAQGAEDDAAVSAALVDQADRWTHLASLLFGQQFGGIMGVDPKFTDLLVRTAALARRQRDLIEQHQDDPVANRVALEKLRDLARSADRYLNP